MAHPLKKVVIGDHRTKQQKIKRDKGKGWHRKRMDGITE